MPFQDLNLPTPLALVANRVSVTGIHPTADSFLAVSYVAEAGVKLLGISLYPAFVRSAPEFAYKIGHALLHADGLGMWDTILREATTQPRAGFLPPEFGPLLVWLTRKRGRSEEDNLAPASEAARGVLSALGLDEDEIPPILSIRDLISVLVLIRNKTKAHGAVGTDFYAIANESYVRAVRGVLVGNPLLAWAWIHLSRRDNMNVRAIRLLGTAPHHLRQAEANAYHPEAPGVYLSPEFSSRIYPCMPLIEANRDCTRFLLPNGGYSDSGSAEFLDYATGTASRVDVEAFLRPPAPLPRSVTHGLESVGVQSNVFGNLPQPPSPYVQRLRLQAEIATRLHDRNHSIVTLHGRGGVGKTRLALWCAHTLAAAEPASFESIVWFSARDLELRPSGPRPVQPAVSDLPGIAKLYARLFNEPSEDLDGFARVLEQPDPITSRGRLFIFDNFETMADMGSLHEFLDTHTILPNKVLLTSRERAFRGDYPIEVAGLDRAEADELLHTIARDLDIEGLLTPETIESIYTDAEGHAYVMRILLGEMAKDGHYTSPKMILPRRADVVNAVFERSFNKLSAEARYLFLLLSASKLKMSELALIIVLGKRGADVRSAVEECLRLALISHEPLPDGKRAYAAPQLARLFARRKLEGDPDRLLVQEDAALLARFGALGASATTHLPQEDQVRRFVAWCHADASGASPDRLRYLESLLALTAEVWPRAWPELARFRRRHGGSADEISYALRRAVEELPFDKDVWLARADYAQQVGDEQTRMSCLISAVDADPRNVELVRDVALELCRYVDRHKAEIPRARRGVYVASVRSHMERLADSLDANGLSRLAWLFLLENDQTNALKYAMAGHQHDDKNPHCLNILEKLGADSGVGKRQEDTRQ
ncbi:MAG: hypothetical protein A2W26_04695 [Acidobacteria bacterium RBG_16_64_8]|nr:MAG: hypothetical protein A2W26_04695 [Acidobacteria bacterium RBG_16_64_8]